MKTSLVTSLFIVSTTLCSFSTSAALTPFQEKVLKVMEMEHRTDADKLRDANRAPYQALAFFGLEQDMKVIEFAPGNGWYTKILAPLLKDDGELYLAYKKEWLEGMNDLLAKDVMSKAKKLPIELDWNPEARSYKLGTVDFGMTDADMMLSIREYHNFNLEDKTKLNKATFEALKPGGLYVIVDHTRRHMMPETVEMRRREDPVDVILEVQAAGFVLEKSSNMFYRPDDELRYEVGRKTVTGNTDRFTLVFKKPN
ncbi:class I SAM-dependent methyltransferase [Shewanella sp. TC10]|uniref:class I SAM-dependent methyltransferase n=1 Tax=Shewanella sp. TC10 TaxID=1419739 RepID=UPI00129E0104|nr:class I SAM-dependent methyltransferase [Shewanella sp. TC10]